MRWQNLKVLLQQFLTPGKEELGTIYYFSAIAEWLPSKALKHAEYISALKHEGIKVILGKFKAKEKKCQAVCKKYFTSHEEKESDVNVAIFMLSDMLLNNCDMAYLVSGDSDMKPAVELIKKLCPTKRLGLIIPPYQKAADLKSSVDFYKKIRRKHLIKALFPEEIKTEDRVLKAPMGWLPVKE